MGAFLRKYGVAATIDGIVLVEFGATDYKANPTLASGDAKIGKDGGAFANLATLPTVTPSGGRSVRISLSSSEMEAARLAIQFVDQTDPKEWEDQQIVVESYGNASAAHAFDLDLAALTTAQVNAEVDAALGDYDGPTNAEMEARTLAAASYATAANQDTLLARLTAARAGYLDNLNVGGAVASSAEVTAITNNTLVVAPIPMAMERPDAGSIAYRLDLYLYDSGGDMEAPDSTPTIAAKNQVGTDRSANLGTVTLVSTGHYYVTYTVASDHALEQVIFDWAVVEGGDTRVYGRHTLIVDTTAVDFTAADRTKLDTLHDTRITAGRASNLDNLDAAVSTRSTLTTAQVNAEVDTALADYDPPTKAELDSGLAGLNDLSAAEMNAQVDAALNMAIPGSPTADSINERIKAIDDKLPAGTISDFDESADGVNVTAVGGEAVTGPDDLTGALTVTLGAIIAVHEPGNRLSPPSPLEMKQLEKKTFLITVVDADNQPVDLSTRTLRFTVHDSVEPTVGQFKIDEGAYLTKSASVASVTVQASEADATHEDWHWELWDTDVPEVLAHGSFKIKPAVFEVT